MIETDRTQEIIIVRRSGESDEGHHGGAWKIAFADFMTAMMALFLVLWLVNAANEETKQAVASYFNPVKLVERNRSEKGLQENEGGPATVEEIGLTGNEKDLEVEADSAKKAVSEEEFFANPVQSLENIAGPLANYISPDNSEVVPFPQDDIAVRDGITDPLSSEFWGLPDPLHKENSQVAPAEKSPVDNPAAASTDAVHITSPIEPTDLSQNPAEGEIKDSNQAEKELAEIIRREINKALGPALLEFEQLDVQAQDQGVMISLTDQLGFPMFEIGSAVPREPLVKAMDAITKILMKRTGRIRVLGHTDGRPVRATSDDNWRLSIDRARAAFFMLKRAGMDESRISQIAGFADSKLRVPSDPYDDRNRRIELFLELGE